MSDKLEPDAPLLCDASWVARLAPDGPQLAVRWTRPRENFVSSLRAVVAGPRAPRKFLGAPYFRDCWISPRWPALAFIAALALETVFVLTVHPRWNFKRPSAAEPYGQLTWYQPPSDPAADPPADLPALSPKPADPDRAAPEPAPNDQAPPAADAYNARQTIWSQPLKPNHPRQELLEPDAADTPPKILPALPNIVQWSDNDSANPNLRLSPTALRAMQPARTADKRANDVAAPDIANPQNAADPIDIAPAAADSSKPAMVVPAMSKGQAPAANAGASSAASAPAPEIGPSATDDGGRVIALSETPGPAAPAPAVPQGNLQARVSMSPNGGKGAPNGAGSADAGARAGSGPPGIGIGTSARLPDAPVATVSGAPGAGGRGYDSERGEPGSEPRASSANVPKSAPSAKPAAKVALAPGEPPESLLGTNHVYTLNVSMPNLSSAMGNWQLSFAELDAPESIPDGRPRPADSGLSGPVPLRKVDPKYPPELKLEKVEGEVVVMAVIRKDGSVDSIQLVQGLDPQLDENAMEALGRWKFQPAERDGQPVELVAIVHIPFHAPPPEPVY
jgi:periplasmic protein TonB